MKNKVLLLATSLISLSLLAAAAIRENVMEEWRVLQGAARGPTGPIDVRLRQIVVPATNVADRCVTCHVGMAAGEPQVPGDAVLKPHPNVVHDPGTFGCTVCHGGQSRATSKAQAHGTVEFWPEPMIPRRDADAGCGGCHTQLGVPSSAALEAGQAAYERNDCAACHRMDGRGGTLRPSGHGMEGPDLSRIGATGYRPDWHAAHLAQAKSTAGTATALAWTTFAAVSDADRETLHVYLDSRHGAPGLVAAKALFETVGCRGCHTVAGVGGSDGPDLSAVGRKDPGRLDFTHVPGGRHERSLSTWFAEHFRAPATVVAGSRMPVLGLTESEIEKLTRYMLSLRGAPAPGLFWPKDRIRAERFGERDFATDGATLYGSFCAACHGRNGEGMRYSGTAPFPAIASSDFLRLVSDDFLRETIRRGRPGRRMASWDRDGGLRPAEIDAIVAHIRTLGGVAAEIDTKPARWAQGNVREGETLFAQNCALCHGPKGEGTDEGLALANPTLLQTATDTYLFRTIGEGRRGTTMEGFKEPSTKRRTLAPEEIEAIVTFLRSWEKETAK